MKKLIIVIGLLFASCSSDCPQPSNEPVWNIDKELENDFWVAVNMLEEEGTNLTKLQSEDIEVIFVDEIGGGELTVALATKINGAGIRILVLEDKWKSEKNQQVRVLTMVHEIGHDYFNSKHYENGWDIMNSISDPNKPMPSDRAISNSINRMIEAGRKNYDSLTLMKRF